MLPPDGDNAKWHYMADGYGSSAWDVDPYIQIAGICGNDSVIVDGAYGASIRWKSFYPVWYEKALSFRRRLAVFLMHFNFYIIIIGAVIADSAFPKSGGGSGTTSVPRGFGDSFRGTPSIRDTYSSRVDLQVLAVFLLLLGIGLFGATPALIRIYLGGKFRNVQAALFGVEGYLDPATAERAIFGSAQHRMRWSTNGSPLSRSYVNESGELVGLDPLRDPSVRDTVELAKVANPGQRRVSHSGDQGLLFNPNALPLSSALIRTHNFRG